jgi:hypothetical protein
VLADAGHRLVVRAGRARGGRSRPSPGVSRSRHPIARSSAAVKCSKRYGSIFFWSVSMMKSREYVSIRSAFGSSSALERGGKRRMNWTPPFWRLLGPSCYASDQRLLYAL